MSELPHLIDQLQKSINRNEDYIRTIRHPQLLVASLQELNDLIGNDKVKDSVATQVSHLITIKMRAAENNSVKEDDVMLNTVLYGPPGVGKTLVGTKLAKIWYSLGYLDGTRNSKERKQELGVIIKDFFKEGAGMGGSGSTSSDDSAINIFIMAFFIVILISVLSLAWSFYNRFGGPWTFFMICIIFFLVVAFGYYLSTAMDESNNQNNQNNQNTQNTKNTKNSSNVKGNTNSTNNNTPNNPNGIRNKNTQNEYGNSPVMYDIPSDDQIIKVVTRADFVDRYVGWSDKKTIKLLEENLGKVVFVDEAYSLVTDMHDSFGMEVLTTINLFLSQHSREIIVIFAGYKDLMETGIFSFQPGLRRRFMWQFDCNGYNDDQLFEIFNMQLSKKGWGLTDEYATRSLFREHRDAFPAYGGDTERLTFFAELEHSREYIRRPKKTSTLLLTPDHIRRGIAKLRENNIQDDPGVESTNPMANMFRLLRGKKSEKNKSENYDDLSLINAMRDAASERAYH